MSSSLLGCIVLAALGIGGFAGAVVAVNVSAPPLPAASDPNLTQSLTAMASDLDGVKQRLASLELRPAIAERLESPAPRHDEAVVPPPTEPVPVADPAAEKAAAIAAAAKELGPKLERLLADGLPADELKKLLAEVSRASQQEGAIAAAEALVASHPNDPKAHHLLAKACYARCMLESTPAGFEKWGGMTLAAWEKASELDPNYWEPRFERAEYLTYYPESEGKTPEVISELEKLITQQGGTTTNPRFAKSYAHLSRMYLRIGNRDKALRALRDGAALFPRETELAKQLEVLEKQ